VIGIQEELQGLRHATMVYASRKSNNVAHVLLKEASSKVIDMV
jgi:hypothetical protein